MSQHKASCSKSLPIFKNTLKRPIDTTISDLSPIAKRQTTITSFFQMPGSGRPPKLEFTDISVNKKRVLATNRKRPTIFHSPKKPEDLLTERTGAVAAIERNAAVTNHKRPTGLYASKEPKTGSTNTSRGCPFFKKIPDTNIVVDAFSYGSIPGVKHYFLSHFHYDHYQGLNKHFQHPIYCTKVTANLIFLKIGVPKKYVHVCSESEPFVVDGVTVQLFDANHCPGSVMFLFEFPDGRRILHTGDFRATSIMTQFSYIDSLYLDTTYLDPRYCFPSQDGVIQYVVDLVELKLKTNPKTLIICGSYTIGKERLFLAVAKNCNLNIWAATYKRQILHCLEDDFLNGCLVTNWKHAQVHVLKMNDLTFPSLHRYLSNFEGTFNEIVAFQPTGWACSKLTALGFAGIVPRTSGCISLYDVPYSEHSSFLELKHFVQALRPQKVIPTVTSSKTISEMNAVLKQWINH